MSQKPQNLLSQKVSEIAILLISALIQLANSKPLGFPNLNGAYPSGPIISPVTGTERTPSCGSSQSPLQKCGKNTFSGMKDAL